MKKNGRNKRQFTRNEIIRANFLYYTNDRNLTDIAKIMKASPPVIYRYLFKNKNEYYRVADEWTEAGFSDDEKVEAI